MRSACRTGFNFYHLGVSRRRQEERDRQTESSKSHSLSVSLRSPHSMLNTSERIAAAVGVSCTPDRSTERGLVADAR